MHTLRFSRHRRFLSFLPLALWCFAALVGTAHAQTVIDYTPYVIGTSGTYVLSGNLNSTSTQPAIRINAPNVILDLSGYYVAGPGNPAAINSVTNSVVYVGEVANVTIRNGTLAGHAYGIYCNATTAAAARNYLVENVVFSRCYFAGIRFPYLAAPGSRIRNCRFSTIGNATVFSSSTASAIATSGAVRIENNNIGDVTATGNGTAFGIESAAGDFVTGNTIGNCKIGVNAGKYLNNLTFNVTVPFNGGTNASGNN